ncbi:hypothetical protein AB4Z34_35700 [Ensifer sp. 2YAB10]|uniref:hypothetical protein n=1 Tax=Ensifer sp. 2YAB10 TaxID=3233021 RepID=UPI003F90195A
MPRTADYTIQGFLYQFNKTLLAILQGADTAVVTVEGIIEDIEVVTGGLTEAIQCKYHETNLAFTYSALYKPLLQMMQHFHRNPGGKVTYVLFAHFPGLDQDGITVSKQVLLDALASKDKKYAAYIKDVKGLIDLDAFLLKLKPPVGPSYDALVLEVQASLQAAGIAKTEIETLVYPNAIQAIASLSIRHQVAARKITKRKLLDDLETIKTTAISHWTLGLKNRQAILTARRKQLKANLTKNARLRYFLVDAGSLPTFCISATKEQLSDIKLRLHQKGTTAHNGYVEGHFDEALFHREPLVRKAQDGTLQREFSLRLLRWQDHAPLLDAHKPADLFVLGDAVHSTLNTKDVNIEVLASSSFDEIKFILGIKNACD